MFNRKTITLALAIAFFVFNSVFGASLADDWNDFLHYVKIGRLDLAKGYAQAVINSRPKPVSLLELSQENSQGYAILLKVIESTTDEELAGLSGKILEIIEQGRFARRSAPRVIVEEIKRLSGTTRGRMAAIRRLQDAGEYAIPYMLDAIADDSRRDEFQSVVMSLHDVGRSAIRPLAAALQTDNVAIKAEIIMALGKIGYPQAIAYLKYVAENDASAELQQLAIKSIRLIDQSEPVLRISAAQWFYKLGENYYIEMPSLNPAEDADFANMWFWDKNNARLIRREVSKKYFYPLMSMRSCEWSLKADPEFGRAIGLWLAANFKAESAGIDMPEYFGEGHADAMTYATTAGAEYLHQALARALRKQKRQTAYQRAYVALGAVDALGAIAGEKSLRYQVGPAQPLMKALSFEDKAVRYSAAIAVATAGPTQGFAESRLVIKNLSQALAETSEQTTEEGLWTKDLADVYAVRAAEVMLELVQKRNSVIDLTAAQRSLIKGTKDKRAEIQVLCSRILARIDSPNAQRAIAAMALNEYNDIGIRIAAFKSLAVSAKTNANLLGDATVNDIYSLVGSQQADAALRSAAASAYGALNLPSRKVKDLILDQAKS